MTFSDRSLRGIWTVCVAVVATLYVAGETLQILAFHSNTGSTWGSGGPVAGLGFVAMTVLFAVAGLFITRSQPRNRIGWVLVAIGFAWGIDHLCSGFAAFFWQLGSRPLLPIHSDSEDASHGQAAAH